jgi:hypothetical protein
MKIEELKLTGERILIKPLKIHKHIEVQHVPKKKASISKDKDNNLALTELPVEEVDKWEEVKQHVISEVQKATVLAVADKSPFKVGDVVLYYQKMGIPFNHIYNTYLLKWYDVIGTVSGIDNSIEDGANIE